MFSSSFPSKAAVEWLIHSYFVFGRFLIPVLAEDILGVPQPVTKKKKKINWERTFEYAMTTFFQIYHL
jgi:hypothetical protein